MKNSHAIIVLLLIVLAICLAFLLWPDKQHDSHTNDHAEVVANNDTLKAHEAKSAKIIDSLSKRVTRLDSANTSLRAGQQQTDKKLNAKTAEVRTLVAQIREINQDTGYFGHLLDSLQEQVESLSFLVVQYTRYADSLNNVYDSLKVDVITKDAENVRAKAELQASYDKLFKSYGELFATTQGLMKDLKRQKLKTKVAAMLGGALALISLLK